MTRKEQEEAARELYRLAAAEQRRLWGEADRAYEAGRLWALQQFRAQAELDRLQPLAAFRKRRKRKARA